MLMWIESLPLGSRLASMLAFLGLACLGYTVCGMLEGGLLGTKCRVPSVVVGPTCADMACFFSVEGSPPAGLMLSAPPPLPTFVVLSAVLAADGSVG